MQLYQGVRGWIRAFVGQWQLAGIVVAGGNCVRFRRRGTGPMGDLKRVVAAVEWQALRRLRLGQPSLGNARHIFTEFGV